MCLAVPMRVISLDGFVARCEARGVQRDVNLLLLQHESVTVGDELMVHLGNAIEKMSPERAAQAWAIYDEIFERLDAAAGRA